MICAEHTRMSEQGYTCISCLRLVQQEQQQEREQQEQKQQDSGETTDDPYFYASDDYDSDWDPNDRSAFRSSAADSSSDEPEADFGAS
jgi:hypothetical protein